jgi:hypothetical protein
VHSAVSADFVGYAGLAESAEVSELAVAALPFEAAAVVVAPAPAGFADGLFVVLVVLAGLAGERVDEPGTEPARPVVSEKLE